ncbi:MAG: hypothetical protein RLZZ416_762 [Candidatus Parcubacteria bacterium]|jgi:hypothetical protein
MDPTPAQTVLVFGLIWGALGVSGIWESYVEGRNAWDRGKLGWKTKIGSFVLTGYHFWLFWVMYPLLLALPFVFTGWNAKLFGVMISAYASGVIIEDFAWYLANPVVKFREWFTDFSDYYPWVRIGGRKIIPAGYVVGILIAILSWYFLWK